MLEDLSHGRSGTVAACKSGFNQRADRVGYIKEWRDQQPCCQETNSGFSQHNDPNHQTLTAHA